MGPSRKAPDAECEHYVRGLREDYPDVAWATQVAPPSASLPSFAGGMDIATFVSMHMRKIWEHVASSASGIPQEVVVALASGGLRDSCLPYTREKLLQYVPGLKPAYLDELLGWQSDALAVSFAPKQHRVVEKNETVPFKGVRQPGGTRSGAYGRVIKVREVATEAFFARKSGDIGNLTQELDILRGLPPSDHNVSLRASYVKDRQLHLIVTPWAKTDLAQFIANPEVLPGWAAGADDQKSTLIVGWLNCLAVGLAKLHAQHIKHKDIKPANILLADTSEDDATGTWNARPVYCDFGLSKLFSEQSKTAGGGGTSYYLAPEQLEGRRAGRAADIFSLGCVFLELAFMLAGKKRKKLIKCLNKAGFASSPAVIDGQCVALLQRETPFWTGLKGVVGQMLKADASLRPTAHDVSCQLAEISIAASFVVHCSVDTSPAPTSPPMSRHSHDTDSHSSDDGEPLC
jgi:hypothetical protein